MSEVIQSKPFSHSDARRLVKDLFEPNPWVYWTDFSITYSLGFATFFLGVEFSPLLADATLATNCLFIVLFAASCLAFYRAAIFIHEVVHIRPTGRMKSFRFMWNMLCGIPFLVPSFIYYTHIDHHRTKHFGTDADGEYVSLANGPRFQMVFFVVAALFVPLLAIIRFSILTPLAWCIPGLRTLVHKHASSLVMDPSYIRPLPKPRVVRVIQFQEFCCFAWCIACFLGASAFWGEQLNIALVHTYAIAVVAIILNNMRTLGAHRWHSDGQEMTLEEQLLDSVNYPNFAWIGEMWGPVGLRFHALHHLFPSMPYHSLPTAHRRLVDKLPPDSLYLQTEEASLTSGICRLWRSTRQ